MTEAVCLSVSGDWLKLAPDVAWPPESQGDNELLTFKRASLGHCSARKIWQTRTLSLSSALGGGVALTAISGRETCGRRYSRCGWWLGKHRSPIRPVCLSFSPLPWISEGTLANSCPIRRKKDHRITFLSLLRERGIDFLMSVLLLCFYCFFCFFLFGLQPQRLSLYSRSEWKRPWDSLPCTWLAAPVNVTAVIICDEFLFTD